MGEGLFEADVGLCVGLCWLVFRSKDYWEVSSVRKRRVSFWDLEGFGVIQHQNSLPFSEREGEKTKSLINITS